MPLVPKETLRYPRPPQSDDPGEDVREYAASEYAASLAEKDSDPPTPLIGDPKKLLAKLPETVSDPPVTHPEPDSSVPASTSILKIGDTGEKVKFLQGFLNLPQDGVFGQNTSNAVKKFQREHGLDSDGVVGGHTQGRIDELLAEKDSDPPIPSQSLFHPSPQPESVSIVTPELVRVIGQLEGTWAHTGVAGIPTYPFGVTKTFIDGYNAKLSNKNDAITAEAYEKAPDKYIAPLMEYHFGKLQDEPGLSDKWDEMPPGVKNAVFSLTWNLGVGGAPKLMKELRSASKEQDESSRHEAYVKALREEALDAFLAEDKGEKKAISLGLAKRRAQEYNLAGEGLEGFSKIATVEWDKPNVVYTFADGSKEKLPGGGHDRHSTSIKSILGVEDLNENVEDLKEIASIDDKAILTEEPLRYPRSRSDGPGKDVQKYVASLAENENVEDLKGNASIVEDSKETEQQAESISASQSVRSSNVLMEDREARERNQKLTPVDDLDDNLNFLTRLHPDDDTAMEHSVQRHLALIPTRATQPQHQAVRDPDDEPADYNGKDYTVRGGVVPAKTLTSLKIDVVPPNVEKLFFANESPDIDAWWSGAVNVNPELEEFSASTKTIGEVLRKQTDVKTAIRADNKKRNVDNPVSSAVGKYQIVGNTLREAMRSPEIKALGITNDTVFDEPTQDKIMLYYLMRVKQPKLREYFNTPRPTGERLRKAMAALGREWEAFRVGKHGERDAEEIVKTMHAYYKRFRKGRMTL